MKLVKKYHIFWLSGWSLRKSIIFHALWVKVPKKYHICVQVGWKLRKAIKLFCCLDETCEEVSCCFVVWVQLVNECPLFSQFGWNFRRSANIFRCSVASSCGSVKLRSRRKVYCCQESRNKAAIRRANVTEVVIEGLVLPTVIHLPSGGDYATAVNVSSIMECEAEFEPIPIELNVLKLHGKKFVSSSEETQDMRWLMNYGLFSALLNADSSPR